MSLLAQNGATKLPEKDDEKSLGVLYGTTLSKEKHPLEETLNKHQTNNFCFDLIAQVLPHISSCVVILSKFETSWNVNGT